MGRFINQDFFLGNTDNPPSIHRYMYANANPNRFVDPSGNIAILTDLQDRLTSTKEQLIDSAQDFTTAIGDQLPDALKPYKNQITSPLSRVIGGLAGVTGIAEKAVGAGNWIANATVATVAPGSELALEAGAETGELLQSLGALKAVAGRAAVMIVEDPSGAASAASEMIGTAGRKAYAFAAAVLQDDPRAKAQAASFTTELAVDIVIGTKGAGVGRGLVQSAGRQVDELAGAVGRGLREGAEHLPLRWSPDPGANLGNLRRRVPKASSTSSKLSAASKSTEFNVAPHGQQARPSSPYASHHGIERGYLKRNVPGYDEHADPTIMLDHRAGGPHRRISGQQATERARYRRTTGDRHGGDYGQRRAQAIDQMRAQGVPDPKINEWLLEHDGYMFDIGVPWQ